jgi:N-acetylneuraminate synthase
MMENISLVNLDQPLLIAEISCNHMGQRDVLAESVNAAFKAGADLVKLQSSEPDCLTRNFSGPEFKVKANGSPWDGMHLYHLYERTCTPTSWPVEIIKSEREIGRTIFSTPFSLRMVDLLEDSAHPLLYKVSSIDWNYLDLIHRCLSTGKPVMVSLVKPTIQLPILYANGCEGIIPMYCVSRYPTFPEDFNMQELEYLARECPRAFGFSDHSLTPSLSALAVAHGATVIERHFKLNDDIKSDDEHFSANPEAFGELVNICKEIGIAYSSRSDLTTIAVGRSIYVDRDVESGSEITRDDLCIIRPGGGLDPTQLDNILGRRARFRLVRGTRLEVAHLEN